MEYSAVTSNASSRVMRGRMLLYALARIVLPVPGWPRSRILWFPAADMINARLAFSRPKILLKEMSSWG